MALAALLAGLVLGFMGGRLQASPRSTPGQAATGHPTALPVGDTAIAATGRRCAVQLGHALELGIEIMNQSDRPLVLRQVRPVLPLGGLRELASQWQACGALPTPGLRQSTLLMPGASGWLTVTFAVLVSCPQALPVEFHVSYLQAGGLVTGELDSFPDLGPVSYDQCATVPAGQ